MNPGVIKFVHEPVIRQEHTWLGVPDPRVHAASAGERITERSASSGIIFGFCNMVIGGSYHGRRGGRSLQCTVKNIGAYVFGIVGLIAPIALPVILIVSIQ